jgi:NAD-dependent deacetylase
MQTLSLSPSDHLFVLTGAGVSAESGLSTFRDSGGLWDNYRIEDVATPEAWHRDPHLVWHFYSMRRQAAGAAKPNPAHLALAALERSLADRLFLCTQNVDNLHEQAGSQHVLHMHGELFKSRCESCSRPPFEDASLYEPPAELPRCTCGARIRPHICWFGEIPFELDRIFAALDRCTLFLAIGTSGTVEPAASFAAHAKRHARTIYVGPESPSNRFLFDEICLGKAGELLPSLLSVSKQSPSTSN